MSGRRLIIGVDVGGTFTDVFAVDRESGEIAIAKVPSTIDDQSRGFVAGIEEAVGGFDEVQTVVHGTTTGTNALLERKGAKAGIITTRGFRDVLEMRRRDRPTTWGLWGMFEPVVDRDCRLEVEERVLADGTVRKEVNEKEVRDAVAALLEKGCKAVCIFFINGYASNSNEKRAAEIVRGIWPNEHVTSATEILPEIREFERCSTATLNAYLQPVVAGYLDRLQAGLGRRGSKAQVMIVQSNGGVMDIETAKQLPVKTALSGPAAGVIAAREIAANAGFDNVITCDMGGTSFDVSLVAGGQSTVAAQSEIDFGMVIRTPMIEITTIGAGGGSIAHVDEGGLLEIGPESAGSDPGPVAYGFGNDRPTVTDANLVLGRINAKRPIGGIERLDVEAARAAISKHVAEPLGFGTMDAAEAIIRVANAKMAGAIRLVSIERGHDPKEFAMMPFGGGGSLHAGALMREIGLGAAIVPRYPGINSAIGCVIADMRMDLVQTVNCLLTDLDCDALAETMRRIAEQLQASIRRSDAVVDTIVNQFTFDMLYLGQTHTISTDYDGGPSELSEEGLKRMFEAAYLEAYGRLLHDIPIRVMNLRVAVIGKRPPLDLSGFAPPRIKSVAECILDKRPIWFDGKKLEATVYDRLALPEEAMVTGPAIAEQPDTTIFVEPGLAGRIDRFGNMIIRRIGEQDG